jgi:uncharacterized protein YfaP (DUF2135 family)
MRTVAAVVMVALLGIPAAMAGRPRVSRAPSESSVTFTIVMPPAVRLATGLGLGVLYDPSVLRFESFSDLAPDGFYFSGDAELVADPPRRLGQTAMVRLTWINAAGQWPPALHGGALASVKFARLGEGDSQVRVVSLTADDSHAVAATAARVSSDSAAVALELDTRSDHALSTSRARWEPLALPAGQCTPDVDGNGRLDALTDGIVLLRYLFGFTGTALTGNAIGTGATRTSAADIKLFLEQSDCIGLLDIDQSGRSDALTDGIVLVRHLFGFTGDDLVVAALGPEAGRSSPEALKSMIESYSLARAAVINGASLASGASMTDASGDFGVTAVGGDVTVTLTQGTDYAGNRTLDITKSGTGQVALVLPPAQQAAPASTPISAASAYPRVGSLADVSQEWDVRFAQKWFYTCGADNRLPESVQQTTEPTVSSEPCFRRENRLHLLQLPPAVLVSACSLDKPTCYQSQDAVLLIHGYTIFNNSKADGGGTATWGQLPALVSASGYVPFEFRWITAARFNDVAPELGAAIREVAMKTGRKVHIVAHSFGGLLVRTLLQSSDGPSVAPYIADVATLGTPHSGIAGSVTCPIAGLAIPAGSDNSGMASCRQISCYQAGLDNLGWIAGTNYYAGAPAALRDIYQLTGEPGYHIGNLSQSVSALPAVDWLALMGLVSHHFLVIGDKFGTGDDLITYEGQRFLPSMSRVNGCPGSGVNSTLSTQAPQGGVRLWERVLGFTGQPVPGATATTPTDPDWKGGYAHNGGAAFSGGDYFITRPEAKVDCPADCKHDTYLYLLGTDSTHSFFNGTSWLGQHAGIAVAAPTITFRVTVLNSVTRAPVSGATVNIFRGATGPTGVTGSLGDVSLTVPFEARFTYNLRIRANGFVSLQDSFVSSATLAETPTELGQRTLVPLSSLGNGTLGGLVQNATTGVGIANAIVTVRRSDRQTLVFNGVTNSSGSYSSGSIPSGTYIISASATGFLSASSETTVAAGGANSGNVALSPQLSAGQARIVLTWGTNPSDLDSHLRKARSDGSTEYHIYYSTKSGTNGDNLDLDDTTSFGPETVTIQNVSPAARYTYWVHLYTGAGTIAASPTRVTVTTSTGTVIFNAPSSAVGSDWVVFDIVNGQIVPCGGACNVAPLAASPGFESLKGGESSN